MEARIPARPTRYKGVNFRSATEARWAAFFDLLKWRWSYETTEAHYKIPDFTLILEKPLHVEVRGDYSLSDMYSREDTGKKIERSGLAGEVLIVGAVLNPYVGPYVGPESCIDSCIGLLAERTDRGDWDWGPGIIGHTAGEIEGGQKCARPPHYTLRHYHGSYHCRICGERHPDIVSGYSARIQALFDEANNITRWNWQRGEEQK